MKDRKRSKYRVGQVVWAEHAQSFCVITAITPWGTERLGKGVDPHCYEFRQFSVLYASNKANGKWLRPLTAREKGKD